MANEAVIISLGNLGGNVIRRTVASDTSISGMTLCKLTDPNTAAASTNINDVFAGIAASDKAAADGSTDLGFYTDGVFDILCGDPVNAGALLALSGNNVVRAAVAKDILSGCHVGYAEEDVTTPEVIRVRLRGN